MELILALTASQKRHLTEIGLVVCLFGAVAVLLSGAFGLGSLSRFTERTTMVVAGILLVIGFIIQLVAAHGKV